MYDWSVAQNKRFVFLADATAETGAGHIRRCITIAQELKNKNIEILFIGNIEIPWLLVELRFHEFNYERNVVANKNDILIVDLYTLNFKQKKFISQPFYSVVQIIDSESEIIDADIYIHPGPNSKLGYNDKLKGKKYFGGTEYLITRNFHTEHHIEKLISPSEILVLAGGTDYEDFASSIYPILNSLRLNNLRFHLMVRDISNFSDLEQNFSVHKIGIDLENIVRQVDTVLTAAGTSSWDFIANSKVSGVALAINNQSDNFHFQVSNGYAVSIGQFHKNFGWRFEVDNIKNLLSNLVARREMLSLNQKTFDLNGPKRLIQELLDSINIDPSK